MMGNPPQQMKSGFTLIEILVVIAIISLLSSVVFTQLSGVRTKGRDARRISNARQIVNAMLLYADAAGNNLPPQPTIHYDNSTSTTDAYCGSNNSACWNDIAAQLSPYLAKLPIDPINSFPFAFYYRPYGYNYCPGGISSSSAVFVFPAEELNPKYPLPAFSVTSGVATATFYCMYVN